MKTIRSIFVLFIVALLLAMPAAALDLEPGYGSGFYCRDSANVLSAETEDLLVGYNDVLEAECSEAQLVVVTVNYLDEDSDVAATRLMADWGVGSSTQSNGMLLLLVANEYRGWLAVGDGIDHDFDDETAASYLDQYFWDSVDAGQFDEAVQTLCGQLYNWYLDYYDVDLNGGEPVAEHSRPAAAGLRGFFIAVSILILIVLIVVIWVVGSVGRYNRMRGWGYTGGFFPIFWFGGRRRYRDWSRRQPPPPPPRRGPAPGPGPMNFGAPPRPTTHMAPPPKPRSGGARPGAYRGSGFGGRPGGGAGRSSSFRGGGPRGGGYGGHSGGGGAGRR